MIALMQDFWMSLQISEVRLCSRDEQVAELWGRTRLDPSTNGSK